MNKKKVAAMITAGWALPAISPIFMKLGKEEQIFSAIIFAYICVSFTIMVLCYICIIRIVRKKTKEMAEILTQNQTGQCPATHDVRAAKAVAIVIICFVITIIPISIYHCTVAVKSLLPNGIPGFREEPKEICYAVGTALTLANSGINPLIYYLRHPKFKESLVKELETFCPAIFTRKTSSGGNTGSGTASTSV